MLILLAAIAFIVMLSVLVLVHEAGHFFVAKWAGVKVEEFGFGFPPRAWSKKIGETVFSVNWLPIGGFVRMLGQDDFNPTKVSHDPRSFESAKPHWRIAISLAGVVMNLLLAIVLLWGGYMAGMQPLLRTEGQTLVQRTIEGSPAAAAGLAQGDRITAVANVPVEHFESFTSELRKNAGKTITITVVRAGSTREFTITPDAAGKIGVAIGALEMVKVGPGTAFVYALEDTWKGVTLTAQGLGRMVTGIFTEFQLTEDVGGPVRIAQVTYQAVQVGFGVLLQLAALLSISLAVLNAIPFPALDGGHVLFTVLDVLWGKPLNRKLVQNVQAVGMVLLLMLIAATVINDIVRIIH